MRIIFKAAPEAIADLKRQMSEAHKRQAQERVARAQWLAAQRRKLERGAE